MRLIGNMPALCRPLGPGSLCSVTNELDDIRPRLCTSDEDMSSNSLLRAFVARSLFLGRSLSRLQLSCKSAVCVTILVTTGTDDGGAVPFAVTVGAGACRTDLAAALPFGAASATVARDACVDSKLAVVWKFHSGSILGSAMDCMTCVRFCITARA